MTYRDDIDGLRAIAVIAVILSHVHLLAGGYIGVDVFFVISGFLIAPRILVQMRSRTFSLRNFYQRRARRLLPQVYAVIAVSFMAAYILFLPSDFVAFSKSAIATVLYGSNFYFLAQTGYFSPDAITQPLLHTWSLAVEEQFYFVAPLIIYLLVKLKNPLLIGALIGVSSLIASLVTTQFWSSANFFLLPFRAWEFIFGAAIAFAPLAPRYLSNMAATFGIGLIVWSAITLTETSSFPGLNAIPVVIGTGLIIWAGRSTMLAKILATLPMRLTGRASYSLYIWHWPIIVFYSYYSFNDFSTKAQLFMIAATLIVGFLCWSVYEEPVRRKELSFNVTLSYTVIASVIIISLSSFVQFQSGIPNRLNKSAQQMANSINEKNYFYENCIRWVRKEHMDSDLSDLCKLGNENGNISFALWGDSFSASMAYGLSEEAKKHDLTGVLFSMHACPPIIGTEGWWDNTKAICKEMNELAIPAFKKLGVKTVFIHASWNAFSKEEYLSALDKSWKRDISEDKQDLINSAVEATVNSLVAEGITPVFVGGIPTSNRRILLQLTREIQSNHPSHLQQPRSKYNKIYKEANIAFGKIPEIVKLNPLGILCDEAKCDVVRNGKPITIDGNHLTASGSLLLSKLFTSVLEKIKNGPNAQTKYDHTPSSWNN